MVRKPENENNDTFLVFPLQHVCFLLLYVGRAVFFFALHGENSEGGGRPARGWGNGEGSREECWEDRGQGKPPVLSSYSMSSGFGFFALAVPVDLA